MLLRVDHAEVQYVGGNLGWKAVPHMIPGIQHQLVNVGIKFRRAPQLNDFFQNEREFLLEILGIKLFLGIFVCI